MNSNSWAFLVRLFSAEYRFSVATGKHGGCRLRNRKISVDTISLQWRQMGPMASQITSLTIVYSIVYSGADQRKQQSSASLAFVRGIHRGPTNSPHKWLVTRKMLPFDDVIMGRSGACIHWKEMSLITTRSHTSRSLEKCVKRFPVVPKFGELIIFKVRLPLSAQQFVFPSNEYHAYVIGVFFHWGFSLYHSFIVHDWCIVPFKIISILHVHYWRALRLSLYLHQMYTIGIMTRFEIICTSKCVFLWLNQTFQILKDFGKLWENESWTWRCANGVYQTNSCALATWSNDYPF